MYISCKNFLLKIIFISQHFIKLFPSLIKFASVSYRLTKEEEKKKNKLRIYL